MIPMARDDERDGGFSGKRNKSWREIDAQRHVTNVGMSILRKT